MSILSTVYLSDFVNFLSKEARKVIRNHNSSEPLFLYLPLMSLHTPHVGMPPKVLMVKMSIIMVIMVVARMLSSFVNFTV